MGTVLFILFNVIQTNHHTRLVLFNIVLLTAPSPKQNIVLPARHSPTFIMPESSGVIIGIIINRSIPAPRDNRIDSHAFFFAYTFIVREIAVNTPVRNNFAVIHIISPDIPASPSVNGRPAMLPPITVPIKNAISIAVPAAV